MHNSKIISSAAAIYSLSHDFCCGVSTVANCYYIYIFSHPIMISSIIFGAILGSIGCLFFLAKKKVKKDGDKDVKGETLFLNVLILDKSEVIQTQIADKYDKMLPL